MHKGLILFPGVLLLLTLTIGAQVPLATNIAILKAEDERRFDKTLEDLLKHRNPEVRKRAALAAGRIGDEKAIPFLADMVEQGVAVEVRDMAAFALGEIETLAAADPLIKLLENADANGSVLARAVEAAGKIAAANAKPEKEKASEDPRVEKLRQLILAVLERQSAESRNLDREIALAALTAALRARPANADLVVAKFLTSMDSRVRTDAGNTLSRLRGKRSNDILRKQLKSEPDGEARANIARALGAAEDKGALDVLIQAAIEDTDSRVRVSAVRSLAALGDANTAAVLTVRGEKLLAEYETVKPAERIQMNELLEIAAAVSRLLRNSANKPAIGFLSRLYAASGYHSPEAASAWARVDPKDFTDRGETRAAINKMAPAYDWQFASSQAQGLAEVAATDNKDLKAAARLRLNGIMLSNKNAGKGAYIAVPDEIRALAAFKPDHIAMPLREYLAHEDVFIRAAAVEVIADQPVSKENVEALNKAFNKAFISDNTDNDALMGIVDALFKLDKKESVGTLMIAATMPDYLLRKKAIGYMRDKDPQKDFPDLAKTVDSLVAQGKDRVQRYDKKYGTMLGQVMNTQADYTRALSRKNGTVRAILTTDKGAFTIEFLPEEAPLTVDNFVKLAKKGYFNGLMVHRVVPNFVMQDGDPRGDGNGGPGWSIRCEVNTAPYARGAVGMALSGKDTGGSQWFVTHSPQPHLDGGYTVFGNVNDAGMNVVDKIARGDRILSVKIIEGKMPQKGTKTQKR